MKKFYALTVPAALCALASCVNPDYDLSKPVDLEMNIGGKLEMPLKMEQDFTYKLDNLINLEDNSVIKKAENGDYSFDIEPAKGFSSAYTFDKFDFPSVAISCTSEPLSLTSEMVGYQTKFPGFDFSGNTTLSIDGLHESIKKIGKVYLKDTYLDISLKPSDPKAIAYFPQGIVVTLPEKMSYSDPQVLWKGDSETIGLVFFDENHPNVLNIQTLQKFFQGFTIRCKVNTVVIDSEVSGTMQLPLSFNVKFPGDYYLQLKFPGTYYFVGSADISSFTMDKVEVQAVPQLSCQNVEMEIDVPQDFKADGSFSFELEDLCFEFLATNTTPFDFDLSTDFVSYSTTNAGGKEENSRISIGGQGTEIFVPAGSTDRKFVLSSTGNYGEDNNKVIVPGLISLVSPIPDVFSIENIQVEGSEYAADAPYTIVDMAQNYAISVNYSLKTPFRFKSVHFETEQVVALGVNLGEVGFDDVFLSGVVTNALPLDIALECSLADSDGNKLEGNDIKVSVTDLNGNAIDCVPAGSIDVPAVANLLLSIESTDGKAISSIDKLRLKITADAPQGQIASLNAEQFLNITDLAVGTSSGIHINPGADKNE